MEKGLELHVSVSWPLTRRRLHSLCEALGFREGLGGTGTGKAVPSGAREQVTETEAETSMESPKERIRDRDRERPKGRAGGRE